MNVSVTKWPSTVQRQWAHHPQRLLVHGVALLALLAGAVSWSTTGKTVTLSVDGQAREVRVHGDTVADVLSAAGLRAGRHDVVAPALRSDIGEGDRVTLRRGRELRLVVDGQARTVWVTAASVDEAMSQLGLLQRGATAASRSRRIPLSGMELQVRLPKAVSVLVDGHVHNMRTTVPTVRDVLIAAGVRLSSTDQISHPRERAVTDRLTIRVTRVAVRQQTETVTVPFRTVRKPDPSRFQGDRTVLIAGRPGVLVRTFALTFTNGRLTSRTLSSVVRKSAPSDQVVRVGTKPRPAPSYGATGADGLNWAALARCESGGNPRAIGGGGRYRGLYQFAMGTWRGVGGQGDPIDASPAEQTYRAKILYSRSGRSPWPHCGRYL
ncbi:MAG TPA: ubiquitin-like domain-containing protein [Mycobacteriales bacterium]|nr:ubiquitin-like domain-containing protein [Mycobacteriales bacterium]